MENTWYLEKTNDDNISQGDIFLNCPIVVTTLQNADFSNPRWYESEDLEADHDTHVQNVIVMTQACDLERTPVENVLVALIHDINSIDFPGPKSKGQKTSRKSYIKEIYGGKKPNLHLIGNHDGSIKLQYQIVDFTAIYTIPYKVLEDIKSKVGPRLRLNTPHREYLSQRFGSFYSRIGLPDSDHITQDEIFAVLQNDEKDYSE